MACCGGKKPEPVPFIMAALKPDSTGGSLDITACKKPIMSARFGFLVDPCDYDQLVMYGRIIEF
jgi:hypothetical protein